MKICTDSLMFGSTAEIQPGDSVLDIGAGCGILALMLAQLGAGSITAVEIHPAACLEAAENFRLSRWANRLQAVNQSIQTYAQTTESRFDFIISNPPFFANHLKSVNSGKRLARHNDGLSYTELIVTVLKLLKDNGQFYVLLPVPAVLIFIEQAEAEGLLMCRRTDFRAYADKKAKVAALSFKRHAAGCRSELFTIFSAAGQYSPLSKQYLQPFLLRFAHS